MTCSHSSDLLCTTCLADRWGCTRETVARRKGAGQMPAPFNAQQSRGWLWHRSVIEAHERGASTTPPSTWPRLEAAS